MPIPTGTAAISFSQLRTEMHTGLGNPAAYSSFPLNDSIFRLRLTDTAVSGALSLSALRGNAYLRFTIAANTTNYNIRTAFVGAYPTWPGGTKASANVVINANIVVGSPSTGSYAMDTGGPWPGPSTIAIHNDGGYIVGVGGVGGNGSPAGSAGSTTPGGAGGPALNVQQSTTIYNTGATIGGGGGGGGGGRGNQFSTPGGVPINSGGGGGGGGRSSNTPAAGGTGGSAGGANPFPGNSGFAGTFAAAGNGRGSGGPAPGGGTGGAGGAAWGFIGNNGGPASPAPTLPARAGGGSGVAVQGWSLVTAPGPGGTIAGPKPG